MGQTFSGFAKDCEAGNVDNCLDFINYHSIECDYIFNGYFDKYKGTILTFVCNCSMPQAALLLMDGVEHISNNYFDNDNEIESDYLIESDGTELLPRNRKGKKEVSHYNKSSKINEKYKLDYVDGNGFTALILACHKSTMSTENRKLMNDVAIKLIGSGKSRIH